MADPESLFASISDVVVSVSLALAGATDDRLDAVIDESLGALAMRAHADRAYITLYSDETFSNSHEWVAAGVMSQRDAIVSFSLASFPFSVGLASSGRVWQCVDVGALPDAAESERRTFGAFNVKSVLQVPIRDASRTLGVIGFNHIRESRVWAPLSIDLVGRVGEAIALALLRRDAAREVRRARDVAEQAGLAKDRFLSQLNHELQTPLHAILGFAELIDTLRLAANDRAAVHQIRSNGAQLQVLLDELIARSDRPAG